MLISGFDLIRGQEVVSVALGSSFKDALGIMVKHDFSQLPVVDASGRYVGIVSEHGIVTYLQRANLNSDVLKELIDRWYEDSNSVSLDADIGQVLDRLKENNGAVVVVDVHHQPIGVVTYDDFSKFLGSYAYGFMLLEYIERTLRRYVESEYPDPETRYTKIPMPEKAHRAKSEQATGDSDNIEDGTAASVRSDGKPTLQNYVDCIKSNWKDFKRYFGDRQLYSHALGGVSEIRNNAMHFHRDKLSADETQKLEEAAKYLRRCERSFPPVPDRSKHPHGLPDFTFWYYDPNEGPDFWYEELAIWLWKRTNGAEGFKPVSVRFQDIEAGMGRPLPAWAFQHEEWWNNGWFQQEMAEHNGVVWYAVYADMDERTVVFAPATPRPNSAAGGFLLE